MMIIMTKMVMMWRLLGSTHKNVLPFLYAL